MPEMTEVARFLCSETVAKGVIDLVRAKPGGA